MKITLTTFLTFTICFTLFSQKNAMEQAIVDEGMKLYRLELASWHGTDIFYKEFPKEKDNIGGYFSYTQGNNTICTFFDRQDNPDLLAKITFNKNFDIKKAKIESSKRKLTDFEKEYYALRKSAISEMLNDTMFKFYENTKPNLIPIIGVDTNLVFVLTGSLQSGVVIFGNDYLLTFNKENKILSKKKIHDKIIPVEFTSNNNNSSKDVMAGPSHLHSNGMSDLITSTDICTIMLYAKQANWKTHAVISEKYMCIWFCESNSLAVTPREMLENFIKGTD